MYVCLGFIVLLFCVAVVAVTLAVVALGTAKEAKDSSQVSTSTPPLQQKLDPCSTAPCTNGGTCVPLPADNYTCMCGVSDFGEHCQKCKHNLSSIMQNRELINVLKKKKKPNASVSSGFPL